MRHPPLVSRLLARRHFLQAAALASASLPFFGAPPRKAGMGAAQFTHGVASGDPTSRGVTLWTRAVNEGDRQNGSPAQALLWRVATDPRLSRVVVSGSTWSHPGADHTARVDVTGLRAGTTYWYGFSVGSDHSPVGRTRTLPGPEAERTRIAFLSCGNLETGHFNAYARVAERDDLDLVVHLGDYLYEYGDVPGVAAPLPGRAHRPRVELRTLADYRRRYAQYRSDPDLAHLHARHPMVAMWDDHEVADDSCATSAQAHGPEDGAYATRRAAALRAWHEWHARSDGPSEAWRSLRLGSLVELSLVDGRSYRRHRGDVSVPGQPADSLGHRQLRWLRERLARPAAHWPVIATQQPVVPRVEPDGRPIGVAGWSGFAASQRTVLDAAGVVGALLVAGDVHSSWLASVGGLTEVTVPQQAAAASPIAKVRSRRHDAGPSWREPTLSSAGSTSSTTAMSSWTPSPPASRWNGGSSTQLRTARHASAWPVPT